MSTDDAFVTHLKNLEAPAPPLPVDHGRVLVLGRRRRGVRAAAVSAVSVAAVAGLVTAAVAALPGPLDAAPPATTTSVPTPATTPAPSPTSAHAVIDPVTGVVTTPLSTFTVSRHDLDIMMTAWELARSRCMADAGYAENFVFAVTRSPERDVSRPYGIWNRDELRERGYAEEPVDIYDGEGSEIHVSSPAVDAAMQACADQVRPMGFVFEFTSFDDIAPAVGAESAVRTPEGQAVVAEWTACLAAHGVPGPDEFLQPAGVLGLSLDEQVRIGLIDIDCKESTNLRQRLADIDAVLQQAYLDSAPEYVAAYRATVDAALAASRAYLSEAGIEMP